MFLWFGDVREISYFAALRLRLLSQLDRVSNSSRLETRMLPIGFCESDGQAFHKSALRAE